MSKQIDTVGDCCRGLYRKKSLPYNTLISNNTAMENLQYAYLRALEIKMLWFGLISISYFVYY